MRTVMAKKGICFLLMVALFVFSLSVEDSCGSESDDSNVWSYNNKDKDNTLEIYYKFNGTTPQYAVIDLDDSYFRMVYNTNSGANSGWGTSVILFPSFWTKGICDDNDDDDNLCQGTPIEINTITIDGDELVISITGEIGGLSAQGQIRLLPPHYNSFSVIVNMTINGDADLDTSKIGEIFKPVKLSSMHISAANWDAQLAFAGSNTFEIPQTEWLIQPQEYIVAERFGLIGGTSTWKTNAPTIEITLNQPLQIAGWVTGSANANDDNVGLWASSNQILSSWQYTITVKPHYSVPKPNFVGDLNSDGTDDIFGIDGVKQPWYTTNFTDWSSIPGYLEKATLLTHDDNGTTYIAGIATDTSVWLSTDKYNWEKIDGNIVSLTRGDVNNDGEEDLVGLDQNGGIWYTTDLVMWTNIPGYLFEIVLLDINGDENMDIAGIAPNGSLWYTIDLKTWNWIPGYLSNLKAADLNKDGKTDLAGISSDGSLWYTTDLINWSNVPGTLSRLVIGDFNGDAYDDLAGLTSSGQIYYTLDMQTWTNIPGELSQLEATDVNKDGKTDIIGLTSTGEIFYSVDMQNWTRIP
ncbi:MAG: hypothetical protein L3V56_13835, partial [Candidatus Magnetoovum sp. WYHC-5]|nr:hypothetical protein [Candidatus Magnetoovum sp. WYHC-5]